LKTRAVVYVDKLLKRRMEAATHVNWSAVAAAAIVTKLDSINQPCKYDYRCFLFTDVVGILHTVNLARMSQDSATLAVLDALAEGFRWVRTDGDFCVFERINEQRGGGH
jgi:hypothetical protein